LVSAGKTADRTFSAWAEVAGVTIAAYLHVSSLRARPVAPSRRPPSDNLTVPREIKPEAIRHGVSPLEMTLWPAGQSAMFDHSTLPPPIVRRLINDIAAAAEVLTRPHR
jgi:hypothetical protein